MKIITDIKQGSSDWLMLRLGKATASNFDKIITSNGTISKSLESYAMELAADMLITTPEPRFKSEAMKCGNEWEPLARAAYEEAVLEVAEQISFIDCGDYGCSPDGLVGSEGIIEIKCPQQSTHARYLMNKKLPADYVSQVQGLLYCSGRKWCDFISFNPYFKEDKKLMIVRVFRDEEYIKKLAKAIKLVIACRDEILSKIYD